MAEQTFKADDLLHPDHYTFDGMNSIEFIRKVLGPEQFKGFCRGNVLKYVIRCERKGGISSLRKARNFLDWLIEFWE